MSIDPLVGLTILGMALITYATRVTGLWMMGRVQPTPRVAAWMRHIPGAILVALVTPAVLTGNLADAVAGLATVLVAWRTRNLLLAMVVGIVVVAALRAIQGYG